MEGTKVSIGVMFGVFLSMPFGSDAGATVNYVTEAEALAEVGWHDAYGYYTDSDYGYDSVVNGQCQARAYYDEIEYAGMVSFTAFSDIWIQPRQVTLWGTTGGAYKFDFGWPLMDYFYQEGYCTVEGLVEVNKFPTGAPCQVQIDVSFPENTWTGSWRWQVYVESSSDYFLAGWDGDVFYDVLSGTVDAYAGEQIYVFLGNAGQGYADHDIGDYLGRGLVAVIAAVEGIGHVVDLNADGLVNFEDFGHFSMHWQEQDCDDPTTNWCGGTDLDQSSQVDVKDLGIFADYWLRLREPIL